MFHTTMTRSMGKNGYHVDSAVEKIATEIMTNGPVEGAFTVYADFPSYKSGKCFRNFAFKEAVHAGLDTNTSPLAHDY